MRPSGILSSMYLLILAKGVLAGATIAATAFWVPGAHAA